MSFLIQQFNCQPQYSYGNPPDFLFYGLKTYSFRRVKTSGSCTLPGRSRQVLSAPFGKLRRFCPIYDFSSDNSAASRSCLQADTGVIRLQPYLRQTSLNFPKWEMLSFVQHLTVTEVKLVFSHIACSPEAIWEDRGKYNGKST